ncbi:MAG: hypothetical protein N2109_04225 [Fimbriimonadales bacterium]|nr:hypothetical protein [Fimbriimonadales bacterium]
MTQFRKHAAALAALALAASAAAVGDVQGIRAFKAGSGCEIRVIGKNLAKPKVFTVNAGRSVLAEFDANLTGKPAYVRVRQGGVQYATVGWFSARPPKVRVHAWLAKAAQPLVEQREDGWAIRINASTSERALRQEAFPTAVPPLKAAPRPPEPAPPSPVAMDREPTRVAARSQAAPPFPSKVPPLEQVRRPSAAPADRAKTVTLEFGNTDVVLVLRAIAREAGVNIVTSPEVSGNITVSLNKVSLTEALDLVTTMAGLRYAKLGQTFVVTTTARFSESLAQLGGKAESPGATRVVPLLSGEGVQIKAAAFKALPQFTSKGVYDIVLENEEISASTSAETNVGKRTTATTTQGSAGRSSGEGGGQAAGAAGEGQSGSGAAVGAQSGSEGRSSSSKVELKAERKGEGAMSTYVVVVGSPERIDEVAEFVANLDRQLAKASNRVAGEGMGHVVIPVYSQRSDEIVKAVHNLCLRNPNRNAFTINGEPVREKLTEEQLKSVVQVPQQTGNPYLAPGAVPPASLGQESAPQASSNGGPATQAVPTQTLIVVSGPKDALEGISDFARQLDQTICAVTGVRYPLTTEEARRHYAVYDLKHIEPVDAIEALRTRLPGVYASVFPSLVGSITSGSGTKPSEPGGKDKAEATSRPTSTLPMKLLLQGTKSDLSDAQELLAMLDAAPRQVAIELRVMELSKEDAMKIGLDWNLLTGGTLQAIRVNQSVGGTIDTPGTISSDLRFNSDTSGSVLATLDSGALKNKVIARPNVLSTDGRPTEIFVGDVVRYIETIQASQNGTTVTTNSVNVGVQLKLTPRIGADGNVVLDFNPVLTFLKGFTPVPGGGQLPQTSERSAKMVTSIKSGDTIAIGGLIQEQDRKSFSGIPLLKDLPILGQLFGRTENLKTRSEIVFFLTAKVVDDRDRAVAAHPASLDGKPMPRP